MFILQRYKYYILNQKKSEKKFHGIVKKWGTDALHGRPPAQYYEEKVLLTLSRDSRR